MTPVQFGSLFSNLQPEKKATGKKFFEDFNKGCKKGKEIIPRLDNVDNFVDNGSPYRGNVSLEREMQNGRLTYPGWLLQILSILQENDEKVREWLRKEGIQSWDELPTEEHFKQCYEGKILPEQADQLAQQTVEYYRTHYPPKK